MTDPTREDELEASSETEDDADGGPPEEETQALAPLERETRLDRLSPLQRYLSEVRRHPLLTPEEEHELAVRYHDHQNLAAAERLVTGNLRLVVKIAHEYQRNWMDLLDLIQEGNVGLMQGVKRFDPYRGIKLSTYAAFWIRAYILKFLMDNWRLVKIGTTQAQRKLFYNLKKEKERLEAEGFAPGPKLLAQTLEVRESEVQEMDIRMAGREESLTAPLAADGRQTREDTLADQAPRADDALADRQFAERIREKLGAFRRTLDGADHKKEAFLFDRRLLSEEPITLQEAGKHFGVSRERARQLEARLVKNLKAFLQAEIPELVDTDFLLKK